MVVISKDIVKEHGLSEEEYKSILGCLGREPNLLELGIFSVMWSEHCSYKSSRMYLKEFPTEGPHIIQGPGENAGVVDIGGGMAVVFKMESHNHPSYIEPYQGAATGVGGILRDVFTMGARPVAILNSLRFGNLDETKTRFLLKGVVAGIAGYGNCMGVPTVGGEVYFHPSYSGNCLVNAMCVGLVNKKKIFMGKAAGVGNPLLYVGSSTGRDGIHGATMASDVFGEGGEERRPTVQVGDPFTEKLLLEACLEAFKAGEYIIGIQDMGAAGLTSSSVEMADRGGVGVEIDLSAVPTREEGMTPYEIMLSESQERMLIVAKEGRVGDIERIFRKWGLKAQVVGRVIEEPSLRLISKGKEVANIPIHSLTSKAPVYKRPVKRPDYIDRANKLETGSVSLPGDMNAILLKLLSSPNIANKKWIYRQYDHMVRTSTVVLPGSDAAVIRIQGTNKAIAMTVDCNSRYCYLDPFAGGMSAVAEAARNLAATGARPLAITDCLNFGNPERPEIMWQFREAVRGMKQACIALETPVVSGNVSFYNETSGEAVYPTPSVGMVGLIEDISHITTQWFKNDGDVIALIGETREELGGSEYLSLIHGIEDGPPPSIDIIREKAVIDTCLDAIRSGIILSAHDCSEGGLAVALAKACISFEDGLGAEMEIEEDIRTDAMLFGESHSRIIVSLKEDKLKILNEIASNHSVPIEVIGRVKKNRFKINRCIDLPVESLRSVWTETLGKNLNGRETV